MLFKRAGRLQHHVHQLLHIEIILGADYKAGHREDDVVMRVELAGQLRASVVTVSDEQAIARNNHLIVGANDRQRRGIKADREHAGCEERECSKTDSRVHETGAMWARVDRQRGYHTRPALAGPEPREGVKASAGASERDIQPWSRAVASGGPAPTSGPAY